MAKKKVKNIGDHKHLYKYSYSWAVCGIYITMLHKLFYKKIVVEGKENIPKEGPLIFAPNHQNAVMDPLAVLFTCFRQIVFLARADVFQNKILAKLFYFLKILPVFRMRDGKDNLQNNDETYNIAIRVLESKQNVGIFPEARHNNKRSLLPSKKGISRLAFMAEEKNNFDLNIRIIPVGIYYSNYSDMRGILHINYGKPIYVKYYRKEYEENPQKANISLRDDIENNLRLLMIDIKNMALYDTYESIRTLYVKNLVLRLQLGKPSQLNKFKADQITIKALETYETDNPEKIQEIKTTVDEYSTLKRKYKVSDRSVEKKNINVFSILVKSILLLFILPVFLYGFINNLITYFVPQIINSKIKDKQFHSSVKFVWAVFGIPIVYLIQIIIFAIICTKFWFVVAYALSLPISGLLAIIISEWIRGVIEDWRLVKLKKFNSAVYNRLKELHLNIILELDLIITHWNRKKETNFSE